MFVGINEEYLSVLANDVACILITMASTQRKIPPFMLSDLLQFLILKISMFINLDAMIFLFSPKSFKLG